LAILDQSKNKKPFLNDRDDDVFIGLRLPLVLDNGQNASTKTTLDAVKYNLINLISTELGERVMQPELGIRLKQFLFQPFSEEVVLGVKTAITDTLAYWMPFVQVNNILVKMSDKVQGGEAQGGEFRSTMEVSVDFSLKKDPKSSESVQITVGE
jgi:phage baseplate assembly protein W